MTFGSLVAGIGGFDLGFERAGLRCVWQVEIDPFCRRVLAKHWPDVRRHDDVRTFPPGEPDEYGLREWRCDVICGGFPCQDISLAGRGAGLDGERSGLWFEFARVLRLLQPRYAVVENSPALYTRGLDRVLGSLADMGFDADWAVLPASAFGARHIRARLYLVAHAQRGERHRLHERQQAGRVASDPVLSREALADRRPARDSQGVDGSDPNGLAVRVQGRAADACSAGAIEATEEERQRFWPDTWSTGGIDGGWRVEPPVGRVADGVPCRVDRLRALGNAVVPQVAEWLGRRLMDYVTTPGPEAGR